MKLKYIFITIIAFFGAFFTSCSEQDEMTATNANGKRTLTFNLTTDGNATATRTASSTPPAVSNYKVQYVLQILDADGNTFDLGGGVTQIVSETARFEVELPVGVTYTCLFWAHYIPTAASSDSEFFTTNDLKTVALKIPLTADDQCQAFCAKAEVAVDQAAGVNTVNLTRAVAKVNLKSTAALNYFDKLEATYTDVPNTFSVQDNTVSIDAGAAAAPSTFTIANPNMGSDLDGKYTFHTVYFLARGDGNANLLKLELKTYNTGDANPIQTLNVDNVPTKKNFKTNVTATLDAASFTHNFTFDFADWEAEELELEIFSGGKGTQAKPYMIGNEADLKLMTENTNAGIDYSNTYFILIDDIDLRDQEWTPIDPTKTIGYFDGQQHHITGLYRRDPANGDKAGLFGDVKSLSNLHVSSNIINGDNMSSGFIATSGIACEVTGTIRNCSYSGSFPTSGGGICKILKGNGSLYCCVNNATKDAHYGFFSNGGGIAYEIRENAIIVACYNAGLMCGVSGENAGIVRYMKGTNCKIQGCYNMSNRIETGPPNIAGCIVCYFNEEATKAQITDCYTVPQRGNMTDDASIIFASGAWPDGTTTSSTWYASSSNNGEFTGDPTTGFTSCKFWKSIGSWDASDPVYPKLWWEN